MTIEVPLKKPSPETYDPGPWSMTVLMMSGITLWIASMQASEAGLPPEAYRFNLVWSRLNLLAIAYGFYSFFFFLACPTSLEPVTEPVLSCETFSPLISLSDLNAQSADRPQDVSRLRIQARSRTMERATGQGKGR